MADRTYSYLLSSFANGIDFHALSDEITAALTLAGRSVLGIHSDATKLHVVFGGGAGDITSADGALLDGGDGSDANDPPAAASVLEVHHGDDVGATLDLIDCEIRIAAMAGAKARLATAGKSETAIDAKIAAEGTLADAFVTSLSA